jgi:hypothetical protein
VTRLGTLGVALTDPAVRPRVVEACCSLVDAEVTARGGVTGMAVRAGYRAVSAIRPSMVRDAVDHLLPDFAAALEPLHAEAPGSAFEAHLRSNAALAAEALLGVTDGRIEHAKSAIVRKTYSGLRRIARGQLEASMPALARTLAPFLPPGTPSG